MAEVRILEAPSVEDTPSWVDAHSCRARGVLTTGSAGRWRVKLLECNWWYPTPFDVDRPLPYQMTVGTIVRLQLRSEHGPATLVRWSAHMSPPSTPPCAETDDSFTDDSSPPPNVLVGRVLMRQLRKQQHMMYENWSKPAQLMSSKSESGVPAPSPSTLAWVRAKGGRALGVVVQNDGQKRLAPIENNWAIPDPWEVDFAGYDGQTGDEVFIQLNTDQGPARRLWWEAFLE